MELSQSHPLGKAVSVARHDRGGCLDFDRIWTAIIFDRQIHLQPIVLERQ